MILSNREPLFSSSNICVTHLCLTKERQTTTEERALLSVSEVVLIGLNNLRQMLWSHTCLTPGLSGLGPTNISGCLPLTPSTSESGTAAVAGLHQGRGRVQTPSTPELYSSLNLPYNCRWIDMTLQFSPALLSCNNYLTKYFLGGGGLWHENRYNFCIYCKLLSSWLYESAAYFKFCFCIV